MMISPFSGNYLLYQMATSELAETANKEGKNEFATFEGDIQRDFRRQFKSG